MVFDEILKSDTHDRIGVLMFCRRSGASSAVTLSQFPVS